MAEPEGSLDRIVETLKEPVSMGSEFTGRVMAAIERLPGQEPGRFSGRRLLAWAGRRWTIRVSPAGVLAVAAGLAALAIGIGRLAGPRSALEPLPGPGAAESGRRTQFVLVAPEAASVAVVGDFNDWNLAATPLARSNGAGVWWVTVPLPPGRYRYSFVVDGTTWLHDPEAPAVEDEFGVPNSVVTIGGS